MLTPYLIVSAILFAIGALGFLTRRNLIVMFLCAEMMLQGVALNLVAFGHAWANWHGPVFAIFVITVAAAEASIALALVLTMYRSAGSLNAGVWQELREPGLPPASEPVMPEDERPPPLRAWPTLQVAGREPQRSDETEEEAEEAAHV